jgi:hypothetical protein
MKSSLGAARVVALLLTVFLTARCGGPSYGHAPAYVPLDGERVAVEGARPYDAAAMRRPEPSSSGRVVLFGVVDKRAPGPGGQALLRLAVRALAPRNVCARPGDDDSCRVTVADRDLGIVWALVPLREDDDVGARAVGQRSLVRVVGSIGQDVSPEDGAPIVHATFYRHWPAAEYTTPATATTPPR